MTSSIADDSANQGVQSPVKYYSTFPIKSFQVDRFVFTDGKMCLHTPKDIDDFEAELALMSPPIRALIKTISEARAAEIAASYAQAQATHGIVTSASTRVANAIAGDQPLPPAKPDPALAPTRGLKF